MTTRGHHRSRSKRKRKGTKKVLAHEEREAQTDTRVGPALEEPPLE